MAAKASKIDRVAFWILLGALLLAFIALLRPFLIALFLALVFALAIEPIYQFFLRRLRGWRYLAASVSMILLFFFLALPLGGLTALAVDQILQFAPTVGQTLGEFVGRSQAEAGWIATATEWIHSRAGLDVDVAQWADSLVKNVTEFIYQFSPQVITQTTHVILLSIVCAIVTYFLLADGPRLYHAILDISPLKKEYERELANEVIKTVRATVYGYVMTAFVQSILAWLGFWIAGLSAAPLLAMATFLFCFIPIIGSAGVWLPVTVYVLISGEIKYAIFLLIYGTLIISGIDNFLKPVLIQEKTRIHSVLLFLAILGGLQLWGPAGVLAGPTLVAILLATLRIYQRDFLGLKGTAK